MGVLAAVMGLVVLLQLGAGCWLAVQGQWSVIGYGVVMMFVGALVLGVAQIPANMLVTAAERRGRTLRTAGVIVSATLWGSLCMTFWCELSAQRSLTLAQGSSMVPLLIWGNGIAALPLQAIAVTNRGFWITVLQAFACLPLYAVSVSASLGHFSPAVHQAAQAVAVLMAPVAVSLVLLKREA